MLIINYENLIEAFKILKKNIKRFGLDQTNWRVVKDL